jgi:hypothetical protein
MGLWGAAVIFASLGHEIWKKSNFTSFLSHFDGSVDMPMS